jgi:hypothetical protein
MQAHACKKPATEGKECPWQVVIEVDGPSHFSVNSRRPLGRTVARKLMIEARGYCVRSIPYYEWCGLEGLEAQQAYIWRLLASALPPAPPALPAAPGLGAPA